MYWAWNKVFAGTHLEFRVAASEPLWWKPGTWWAHEKSAQAVITEYIKLGYYLATK